MECIPYFIFFGGLIVNFIDVPWIRTVFLSIDTIAILVFAVMEAMGSKLLFPKKYRSSTLIDKAPRKLRALLLAIIVIVAPLSSFVPEDSSLSFILAAVVMLAVFLFVFSQKKLYDQLEKESDSK